MNGTQERKKKSVKKGYKGLLSQTRGGFWVFWLSEREGDYWFVDVVHKNCMIHLFVSFNECIS